MNAPSSIPGSVTFWNVRAAGFGATAGGWCFRWGVPGKDLGPARFAMRMFLRGDSMAKVARHYGVSTRAVECLVRHYLSNPERMRKDGLV